MNIKEKATPLWKDNYNSTIIVYVLLHPLSNILREM